MPNGPARRDQRDDETTEGVADEDDIVADAVHRREHRVRVLLVAGGRVVDRQVGRDRQVTVLRKHVDHAMEALAPVVATVHQDECGHRFPRDASRVSSASGRGPKAVAGSSGVTSSHDAARDLR